jgi:hypothetical protein
MNMEIPTPEELLASDLDVPAKVANMFRVRADNTVANTVVFDFGYLPPILPNDIPLLKPGSCRIHTRISIPFSMARAVAQNLMDAIDKAEEQANK